MELSVKLSVFSLLSLILQTAGQEDLKGIKPQFLKAGAGESVTIKCAITPKGNIYSFKWTFGCDKNLDQHQRYKDRTQYGRNKKELTINNLTEEDSGIYYCYVEYIGTEETNETKETGPGTILAVTPISDPAGAETTSENESWLLSILYIIIGLETCIIIIILAAQSKCQLSGSSNQRNKRKDEPEPTQEICYAEVSRIQKNQHPRTKCKEETITYASINLRQ